MQFRQYHQIGVDGRRFVYLGDRKIEVGLSVFVTGLLHCAND